MLQLASSSFMVDAQFERVSTAFLKNKTKILDELGVKEIVEDRKRQLEGVDMICDIPHKIPKSTFVLENQNVDMKSIASDLPTFCFELLGNQNSKKLGWLLQDNRTDYYLIVYHDIENSQGYNINKRIMTEDNVTWTRALLIQKKRLMNTILKKLDIHDKERLEGICNTIRETEIAAKNKGTSCYVYDGEEDTLRKQRKDEKKYNQMWFSCSNHLKERPINIVIRRNVLESISDYIWEWNREESCLKN